MDEPRSLRQMLKLRSHVLLLDLRSVRQRFVQYARAVDNAAQAVRENGEDGADR